MSGQRFTILPAIDGWEVIDSDGRMVDKRETKASANGVAYRLNGAAAHGPRALAIALRATPATLRGERATPATLRGERATPATLRGGLDPRGASPARERP